jgi:hypothetical protein
MPLEQLVYEELKEALTRQSHSLDELRNRAGTLLGAISIATSFFSSLALAGQLSVRDVILVIAAILAGVTAGAFCVSLLLPRTRKWSIDLSADALFGHLDNVSDDADGYRAIALALENAYTANDAAMQGLYRNFGWACLALGVEAAAWVAWAVLLAT